MANKITISLIIICMCCGIVYTGNFREKFFNSPCGMRQFRCLNGACISPNLYCNNVDNCGDNSDEDYCHIVNSDECPSVYPFYKCNTRSHNYRKCIPAAWRCDGEYDCSDGHDEQRCENSEFPNPASVTAARRNAIRWIIAQAENKTATDRWGAHVRKTSVAMHLSDPLFAFPNHTIKEMAYELSIQLLSKLALRRLKDVPTPDLSSYINALLVTCLNPRKFHSVNLVKELRSRVNAQNYSVPYDLLTLCNAGEKITRTDLNKLVDGFRSVHREFWTATQAVAVMALACASNQARSGSSLRPDGLRWSQLLSGFTKELKEKQYRNGTVENLQTTALVLQALFATEPEDDADNFDEEKALQQILREQKADGSFGNAINTYYVLPVLSYTSLVNISQNHCPPYIKDEDTGLQDLMNLPGLKKRVRYTLWIGDEKEVERTLKLKVASNASFYGVMEVAGDIDTHFRFQYVVKNGKPYVNAISGIQDDPESGRFWFPYIFNGTTPTSVTVSPADLILKENDHVVMWYQSGSWIE